MKTDLYYLAEMAVLCLAPFILIFIGALINRWSRPKPLADGTKPERSATQKMWRIIGRLVFWSGIASILLCLVFVLHYLGLLF